MKKKLYCVGVVLLVLGFLAGCQQPVSQVPAGKAGEVLPYVTQSFPQLKGMEGFSDALIQSHLQLYEGYVKNTNLLLDRISAMAKEGKSDTVEYSELKRRLGFEFNGMRLHEYYFGNLGGNKGLDTRSNLYRAIVQSFGSVDAWKKDFVTTGSMRGIGWAILYVDSQSGRLLNFWISDHEGNHPAGCRPILVMDVWEHAYMADYQLDRPRYIEAFFNNINWDVAAKRYDFSMLPTAESIAPKQGDVSSESLAIPVKKAAPKVEEHSHK